MKLPTMTAWECQEEAAAYARNRSKKAMTLTEKLAEYRKLQVNWEAGVTAVRRDAIFKALLDLIPLYEAVIEAMLDCGLDEEMKPFCETHWDALKAAESALAFAKEKLP